MPAASGGGGGGGGSAGDVRAGGAYYEVVGRDGVSKVIDSIGDKVKGLGGIMDKVGGKGFAGGLAGGFAGGLTGGFLGGGLAGAAVSVAEKYGEQLRDYLKNAAAIAEELKSWEGAIAKVSREQDRALKTSEELRGAMAPDEQWEKRVSIERDILKIQKERKDLFKQFAETTGDDDAAKKRRETIEARLVSTARTHEDLFVKLERTMDSSKDPAVLGAISAVSYGLREQAAAWGLTGTAAARALLVLRGAKDPMLKKFDIDAAEIERLTRLGKDPPPWMSMALGMAGKVGGALLPQDVPMFNMPFAALNQLAAALPPAWTLGQGLKEAMNPVVDKIASEVRSGFATGMSAQQFGYGTQASAREQTDILKQINNGSGQLPDAIAKALGGVWTFK